MKTINTLFIADKFLKYELMYQRLKDTLEKINYKIEPDVIQTSWPDVPFICDKSIAEYVDIDKELLTKIKGKDIIINHVGGIKDFHVENADKLKIIGCVRSLPVNIDTKAVENKGIKIVYAPGRSTEAVAEFTMGLIIMLRRDILRAHTKLKKGEWDNTYFHYDMTPPSLNRTTVGVIGVGYIGKKVCKLLKPFDYKILAYDPFVEDQIIINCGAIPVKNLQLLLTESDIVTIHARPMDPCKKIIGEKELKLMKETAYLINTSRGYLIDYNELYNTLKSKRIAGAAIDTYDIEPIDVKNPLLSLENVIITPHIAGATASTADTGLVKVCNGIKELLSGKDPENLF